MHGLVEGAVGLSRVGFEVWKVSHHLPFPVLSPTSCLQFRCEFPVVPATLPLPHHRAL